MIRLTPTQISAKLGFMQNYISAQNAADGSTMDANANVTQKNIATMESEILKDFLVQINRGQVAEKITDSFWTRIGR
ncbi:anaerobic ribonucleoside-triphosphate reductase [Oligella ureolytica]